MLETCGISRMSLVPFVSLGYISCHSFFVLEVHTADIAIPDTPTTNHSIVLLWEEASWEFEIPTQNIHVFLRNNPWCPKHGLMIGIIFLWTSRLISGPAIPALTCSTNGIKMEFGGRYCDSNPFLRFAECLNYRRKSLISEIVSKFDRYSLVKTWEMSGLMYQKLLSKVLSFVRDVHIGPTLGPH